MHAMKCDDLEQFLDAYLDDEFDARERAEFELHLEDCDRCRARLEFELVVRNEVKACCHADSAPDHLRTRILDDLERLETTPGALPPATRAVPWPGARLLTWASACLVLLGFAIAGFYSALDASPSAQPPSPPLASASVASLDALDLDRATNALIDESVNWHRRRLPVEVAGPHSEEVRTWFRDKVAFPVRIPRFQDPDVALLGGRLARMRDREAALLTMEVNQRKVSLMVFEGRELLPPQLDRNVDARPRPVIVRNASGYSAAIIHDGDLTYSLISDMSEHELSDLVRTGFAVDTVEVAPAEVLASP